MRTAADRRAALRLTRPAQWPILSGQFLLAILLAAPPVGPEFGSWLDDLGIVRPVAGWLAWVVLLNGGTLAFNSAYDRDTGPVAYLEAPPAPPPGLAGWALGLMLAGAVLGVLAVGPLFGGVAAACVALSVAYSHPRLRLKGRPGWDLAVNVLGYGGGTTLAGLAAGAGGTPDRAGLLLAAAFALLFGSFYPLTQIYQAAADRARGDATLATALGTPRALDLALVLGLGAALVMGWGLMQAGRTAWAPVPAVALGAWLAHLAAWRRRCGRMEDRAHKQGMYEALVLWAVVDAALAAAWLRG